MQGEGEKWLLWASRRIARALACADRHTGPCTTSISLSTEAVYNNLINSRDQPRALPSSAIRANVACLELKLRCYEEDDEGDICNFTYMMLQRLPNLIAAKLWFESYYSLDPYVPLIHLKHLDLALGDLEPLDGMPFGELFPSLETACLRCFGPDSISELDVSGCQHLTRLVLSEIVVYELSMLPQCMLRVEMTLFDSDEHEVDGLEQALAEVSEALLPYQELCSPEGIVATTYLPNLEVIRCDGWDNDWINADYLYGDFAEHDEDFEGEAANALVNCMAHSLNLPALKSILIGHHEVTQSGMRVQIPADLAGVQELMIATAQPLKLGFESARCAGENLTSFYAVGEEVRVSAAALSSMKKALHKRGLTLSMVRADKGFTYAPSQCLYMHALSAQPLHYDDVICNVNARVGRWGYMQSDACTHCGACFDCLRKAGILDSEWDPCESEDF